MTNSKNPVAIVVISDGAEELEVISITDTLSRGGVEVITAALDNKEIKCAHGTTLIADSYLKDIKTDELDAIIIPGGYQGSLNCKDSELLGQMLRKIQDDKKLIGAICAAPGFVLTTHKILNENIKATGYPGTTDDIPNLVTKQGVVIDNEHNIITAKGPAFGIEFGLALVSFLKDEQTAKAVGDGMLYTELKNS